MEKLEGWILRWMKYGLFFYEVWEGNEFLCILFTIYRYNLKYNFIFGRKRKMFVKRIFVLFLDYIFLL